MNSKERGSPQTLMSNVYERLRRDLVEGEWRPGARLRMEDLKARYAVGLSPLREALTKLAAEELVVLEEHKGFRAAPISRDDLLDILFVRSEIEALAIRRSIEYGDDRWESTIVATMHELAKRNSLKPDGTIDEEWEQRHSAFHSALVAACRSPRLLQIRALLADQANRYRRLSHFYTQEYRDHKAEHLAIAEAATSRDAERADTLIREHLSKTIRIVLVSLEKEARAVAEAE